MCVVFQNLQYTFQDKRDTKNIILHAIVFWERTLDCVFDSFYDVQKGRKIILKRERADIRPEVSRIYSSNDFALRKFIPVAYFVRIHKTGYFTADIQISLLPKIYGSAVFETRKF